MLLGGDMNWSPYNILQEKQVRNRIPFLMLCFCLFGWFCFCVCDFKPYFVKGDMALGLNHRGHGFIRVTY